MSAADHLSDTQLRLFHGTRSKNVDRIRSEGLRTPDGVVGSAHWFMLTDSQEQARQYSNGGSVIEYSVPQTAVYKHGADDALLWPGHEHDVYGHKATAYALRKPLPGTMIAGVS